MITKEYSTKQYSQAASSVLKSTSTVQGYRFQVRVQLKTNVSDADINVMNMH